MPREYHEDKLRQDLWDLSALHAQLPRLGARQRGLKPVIEAAIADYLEAADAAGVEPGEDMYEEGRPLRINILHKLLTARAAAIKPAVKPKPGKKRKKRKKKRRR